jgi:hypothetical protein
LLVLNFWVGVYYVSTTDQELKVSLLYTYNSTYSAVLYQLIICIVQYHLWFMNIISIITYFPWYQFDITQVIIFWYHIVYSYAMKSKEQSLQNRYVGGKYVIKRISHGLWCDLIFIPLVVRFLSPRQGSRIENTLLFR